jgi:2-polyprenyl-3-methyl-5-hydroxy-6-metoxy-1,4-benzoquinol methylase
MDSSGREERWKEQAQVFDAEAAATKLSDQPFPERTVRRYRDLKRRRFVPEYRFRVAGSLEGKRVLDVGCGMGEASVLLATLGPEPSTSPSGARR